MECWIYTFYMTRVCRWIKIITTDGWGCSVWNWDVVCNNISILSKDLVALKRAVMIRTVANKLGTFTPDSSGELDILGHDSNSFGVDGAQVGILEKTNEVCFASLLQSHDSWALESQIGLEILGDLTNKSLEWKFPDQKFSALLVTTDFSQGDGSGPVSVWFLHTSCGWGTFTCGLGSQLLSWGFATGGLTSGLLCTSHI